jgi:23S rRNA G2069 N7-methylase RlmK/C1962 C5-methylase RlmI
MLDCYCYCGGFALAAALGGATEVTAVDSSARSLAAAKGNADLNDVAEAITWIQSDVPKFLQSAREDGKRFDMVVLDPPKLAPTRSVLDRATAKYMKINASAMELVAPGGLLLTVSYIRTARSLVAHRNSEFLRRSGDESPVRAL